MRHVYDKHELYEQSVQNTEVEVEFLAKEYKRIRGRKAKILREDFCGTGALACDWAKAHGENRAWAIDLDPHPMQYGLRKHHAALDPKTRERVRYVEADVLHASRIKADIVVAFNFSYCIFKERSLMLKYFSSVYKSLPAKGIFMLDIFGGPESQTVLEETKNFRNFIYHWDCVSFNPINNDCKFAIHFTIKKPFKKIRNAFFYSWRLWTIVELREMLAEVGFKQSIVYWEGDDGRGGGNGVYKPKEREENCESWVSYIAGVK